MYVGRVIAQLIVSGESTVAEHFAPQQDGLYFEPQAGDAEELSVRGR